MSTENQAVQGLVFYADGSAKPNPGFAGSGVHGYKFQHLEGNEKPTRVKNWVATNRGYIQENMLGKFEQVKPVKVIEYLDLVRSFDTLTTNNVGELMALLSAFQEFRSDLEQAQEIYFLLDSEYVLKGLTKNCSTWSTNGWVTSQGQPVKNQAAWEQLYNEYLKYLNKVPMEFEWIRGHQEHIGNDHADYLAGVGAMRSRDMVIKTGPTSHLDDVLVHRYEKSAWTNKVDLHPLLDMTRIYFNSSPNWDTKATVFQGGADIGRRSSEAEFAVVKFDKEINPLEQIKAAHYRYPSEANMIMFTRVDRVNSPIVSTFLDRYGAYALMPQGKNAVSMDFMDTKPVTFELKATELPLRTIEAFNLISEHMETFINQSLHDGATAYEEGITLPLKDLSFSYMDLTDYFYDTTTKKQGKVDVVKKALKKDFGVGMTMVNLKAEVEIEDRIQVCDIPLFFGKDLPNRNSLKNIEDTDPQIFVITWKVSSTSFRYATIVKTNDATGIWANYYASQVFLKP